MYLIKTKEALDSQYNSNLLVNSATPVTFTLDTMPDNQIIIKDNVKSVLTNLVITTQVDLKEVGFIIYGKEYEHNKVILSEIQVSDGTLSSFKVNFGSRITDYLKDVIEENLDEKTVIVHGHTHPNINAYSSFFSLGDLASYMEFTYNIDDFKNKNLQLIGMILTSDGKIKTAYYNPYDNRFYKMDNIEL